MCCLLYCIIVLQCTYPMSVIVCPIKDVWLKGQNQILNVYQRSVALWVHKRSTVLYLVEQLIYIYQQRLQTAPKGRRG